MWPWEHLAFGYVLYSATSRLLDGSPPSGRAAVAVAVGTQAPDLIDKPLAWVFDLTAVGYAVGHSALVVVPVLLAAYALVAPDRRRLVLAYGIGHLSHLVGDIIYPALQGRAPGYGRVLWPLVRYQGGGLDAGALGHVTVYLHRYVEQLARHRPGPLLAVQVGLVVGVTVLWLVDGAPGPRVVGRTLVRAVTGARG